MSKTKSKQSWRKSGQRTWLKAIHSNLKLGNVRAAQGQAQQYVKQYKIDMRTREGAILLAWFARIDRAAWELKLAIDNAPQSQGLL